MARLRTHIALMLALMLALTSLSLAVARGQATPAGTIALCSGAGMQMLYVDADGNPTGPPHVCPDGVAALALVDMNPPAQTIRALRDGERLRIPRGFEQTARVTTDANARAPPHVI